MIFIIVVDARPQITTEHSVELQEAFVKPKTTAFEIRTMERGFQDYYSRRLSSSLYIIYIQLRAELV